MWIFSDIQDVRNTRWADPSQTWGLVPTMGALHAGHLSLVERARAENDVVGVSIFVNPKQFNDPDDLEKYPRDLQRDAKLLQDAGANLIWTPTPEIMYPRGFQTYVEVEEMTQGLEGASRPGHFRGVTTVVMKLLNVFQPTRAYFGQKDAQQLAVITRMVQDMALNTEIVPCATVREADGLAMSSRNALLSPSERAAAPIFYAGLKLAADAFEHGERDANVLRQRIITYIASESRARVDYISIADPITLQEHSGTFERALISGAVFIGDTRLIDNIRIGE